MIVVEDIVSNPGGRALALFEAEVRVIQDRSRDRNRANYFGLHERYRRYDAFHVGHDETGLVAFAGLQSFDFPASVCRALSRTYYPPSRRIQSLRPVRSSQFAGMHILPLQVEKARLLGKKGVLVSVEFPRRRAFLERFVEYVSMNTGGEWKVLPDMYLCAAYPEIPTCWQSLAYLSLDPEFILDLPSMTVKDWESRFGRAPA